MGYGGAGTPAPTTRPLFSRLATMAVCLALGILASPLLAQVAGAGVQNGKLYRGDDLFPRVALTFDDGPHGELTVRLLDLLREHKVQATFFVVGKQAEAQPEHIATMVKDGHIVANHTYTHPKTRLPNLSPADLHAEIVQGSATIYRLTGQWPRFFRPPGETADAKVLAVARSYNLITAFSSVNPGDYRAKDAAAVSNYLLGTDTLGRPRVRNGSIVLLHSGVIPMMEALPTVITELRARGFTFVTLDEMITTPAPVPAPVAAAEPVFEPTPPRVPGPEPVVEPEPAGAG